MKRTVITLWLLAFAPAFALGQVSQAHRIPLQSQGNAEQEIIGLEKAFYDAVLKRDVNALGNYLADDYTEVRAHGRRYNKAQVLQLFKMVEGPMERYDIDNLKVQVAGDTVIATGGYHRKGFYYADLARIRKVEYDDHGLYTSVWAKRQGRWQLIAHQDTDSPKPASAAPSPATAPTSGQFAFPVGVYTAKVAQGTWMMDFKRDGTVTVKQDDFSLAPDITYTVKNDQIEISAETTNAMCSGKGTYKWAFDGQALSFQLISDPNCQPRQSVMTSNKFVKQP